MAARIGMVYERIRPAVALAVLMSLLVVGLFAAPAAAQTTDSEDTSDNKQGIDCSQIQIVFANQYAGNAIVQYPGGAAEIAQDLDISLEQVQSCIVISATIPNKTLPDTGGISPLGVTGLSLVGVGAGLSLLLLLVLMRYGARDRRPGG